MGSIGITRRSPNGGTRGPRRLQRHVVDAKRVASIRRARRGSARPQRPGRRSRRRRQCRVRALMCHTCRSWTPDTPGTSTAPYRSPGSRGAPAPSMSTPVVFASSRHVERRISTAVSSDSSGSIGVQPVRQDHHARHDARRPTRSASEAMQQRAVRARRSRCARQHPRGAEIDRGDRRRRSSIRCRLPRVRDWRCA